MSKKRRLRGRVACADGALCSHQKGASERVLEAEVLKAATPGLKPRQLQDHLHQHGYCVEYSVVEKLHRRWKESRLSVVEATPDHSMFMELDELWNS